MLKSIRLVNFFSFRDETIELNPHVNILVGINGSGKSNFLKALELLERGLNGSLEELIMSKWGGFTEIYFAGKNSTASFFSLEFEIDKSYLNKTGEFHFSNNVIYGIQIINRGSIQYSVLDWIKYGTLKEDLNNQEINFDFYHSNNSKGVYYRRDQDELVEIIEIDREINDNVQELFITNGRLNDKENFLPIFTIKSALKNIRSYGQFDTSFLGVIRKPSLAIEAKLLKTDGSNLTQLINTFQQNKTLIFDQLEDSLRIVNPFIKRIVFSHIGNNLELTLQELNMVKTINIGKISDGTLRYICLMSILLNPDRGNLVGIDEPELGLHPDMINQISEAIETAGESSQMLISTHEYRILNHFNVNQILIFEKDEQNATKVLKFNEEQFSGWYDKFLPGVMWRNGDLGGNRW
ncbi:MAG: AAA family ATPase [Cytophagales bacterium]|nr:AAA family ATPase [Cytophagales bacterium]